MFGNIHRKTPVLGSLFDKLARKTHDFEFLFNEVGGLQACNLIRKGFQHRCFPLNIKNSFFYRIYQSVKNPVDTGRKLDVHKTFRRRPGRLLNVLCMFNLRPVSTVKLVCFKERLKLYNLQKHIKIFLGSSASVFTVSFTKFLRTPFLKNTSGCFCYCYIENKFYLNQ